MIVNCKLAIAFLFFLLIGTSAFAQPIVTGVSDLAFGTMYPGVPLKVDKASASAAEFSITGTAGAEVTVTFTLPTYMNVSGYTMQMIFFNTDMAIDSNPTPNQLAPAYNDLDPWQTQTVRLGSAGLTVWLGGKAVPALKQQSGSYVADIVLTVQYTGN